MIVISWLKKYFIPHPGNNHRPLFLSTYNIRIVLLVVVFLEIFSFFIPTLNYISRLGSENVATVLPSVLSVLTNDERQSQKLPTLSTNPLLSKAAELKAQDMATKGYFAHTSPEGKTPWYWIDQVGYQYQYAGENLAINFSDSEDVTKAWMNSPTHRANIVKDKYTEIGTGVARGVYQGKETVFVAQIYASPASVSESVSEATQNPKLKKDTTVALKNNNLTSVLGAETVTSNIVPAQNPTVMQKLLASPKNTTNRVLFIIFGVVLLALLLNIFIEIKHHHLDLITNGMVTLAIIGAIFVLNNYVSSHNMITLDSFNYTHQNI